MITGAIRNKVDKIWLYICASGITNPLTVIEQLTYQKWRYNRAWNDWKLLKKL